MDLGAYVLLLIETKDKKIKLYGSPADKNNLEIGDEVLEINGKSLDNCTHDEAIAYIHKCIRSKTICLKVKRKSDSDLDALNDITDAYAIAVEKKAKERLEKLAAKHNFCPLDMTRLSSTSLTNISSASTPTIVTSYSPSISHKSSALSNSTVSTFQNGFIPSTVLNKATSIPYANGNLVTSLDTTGKTSKTESVICSVVRNNIITPSSIYTIAGLTKEEQDNLNREILSPENTKRLSRPILEKQPLTSTNIAEVEKERKASQTPFLISPTHPSLPTHIPLSSTTQATTKSTMIMEPSLLEAYQTELLKRERERAATLKEQNFLRSSLRDSKKLQELAATQTGMSNSDFPHRVGFVNAAFSPEHSKEMETVRHSVKATSTISDISNMINQFNAVLNKAYDKINVTPASAGGASKTHNMQIAQLQTLQAFIQNPVFVRSLALYQALAIQYPKVLNQSHTSPDSVTKSTIQKLITEIICDPKISTHTSKSPKFTALLTELAHILRKPDVDNLIVAFDTIIHEQTDLPNAQENMDKLSANIPHPKTGTKTLKRPDSLDISGSQDNINAVEKAEHIKQTPYLLPDYEQISTNNVVPDSHQDAFIEPNGTTYDEYPEYPNIKVVRIEKGTEPLGATIRNEGESVVIARVINNGTAQKTGQLRPGDEILEINGVRITGKTVHEVCDLLADLSGTLVFIINRPSTNLEYDGAPTMLYNGNDNNDNNMLPYTHPHHNVNCYNDPMVHSHLPTDMHIITYKAQFNYDPEEDLYIPCRELGLSFQKGDILHVINQMDPNWWQAYRDGEDMHGLAGLIPSQNFQIQRETLKRTLFSSNSPSPRKSNLKETMNGNTYNHPKNNAKLLNTSTNNLSSIMHNHSGASLNALTNNANNSSTAYLQHPNNKYNGTDMDNTISTKASNFMANLCGSTDGNGNNTSTSLASRLCANAKDYCFKRRGKHKYSEYDSDEILTYEMVELYYPSADHKRPIVLIGPPEIGRHELRQRLMQNFPQRFAPAVPHTSRPQKFGEIDGQDYYFLSRAKFEAEIMRGRFVEHGEFQGALYGTSIDSIRKVLRDGTRTCILNLHPQSLKILYHSDLMPYVLFIAPPPNVDKLREVEEKRGVFKRDGELAEIITKAREIDENFGHYFDVFLINSDLDKTYNQLLEEVNRIECEPQWVPKFWLHNDNSTHPSQANTLDANAYPNEGYDPSLYHHQSNVNSHEHNHQINPSWDERMVGAFENYNFTMDDENALYPAYGNGNNRNNNNSNDIIITSSKQHYITNKNCNNIYTINSTITSFNDNKNVLIR